MNINTKHTAMTATATRTAVDSMMILRYSLYHDALYGLGGSCESCWVGCLSLDKSETRRISFSCDGSAQRDTGGFAGVASYHNVRER